MLAHRGPRDRPATLMISNISGCGTGTWTNHTWTVGGERHIAKRLETSYLARLARCRPSARSPEEAYT